MKQIANTLSAGRTGRRGRKLKSVESLEREVSSLDQKLKKHGPTQASTASSEFRITEKEVNLQFELARRLTRILDSRIALGLGYLNQFWGTIRYLGPLREHPKRYYEFNDAGGIDIGVSGEFSVQVLALEGSKSIRCSRLSKLENDGLKFEEAHETNLLIELNYWLALMGLPEIRPSSLAQALYSLHVSPSDQLQLSLPDVGFGVSQVLPIIIECLRAEPGETVILEQPEIHLHPKIQSTLVDRI